MNRTRQPAPRAVRRQGPSLARSIAVSLLALLIGTLGQRFLQAAEPVDFERDIKPIFAARCFECHGDKKQESGLRLDRSDTLVEGGNSGPAFAAGKPDESLLIQVVSGAADVPKMPPKGPSLEAGQIDLLRRWIAEGAKVPQSDALKANTRRHSDHWSFQPLADPQPPAVKNLTWARSAIDRFVLARLEAAGLAPSPEADRQVLIRRLSLDLLGLPPTVEQIDAFLADQSPDAYERLVDRLLASPHYGERWGRHWLDVARYADSNGYTIDGGRSIWKYRDWVISALNRDLPFSQFAIEQLAGDLLPGATLDQQIATGFHRNTLVNEEGGTDPEQFRVEAVVDRVSTSGAAFLGLTLGCARCHDHKYDPISQRDFYQVFALFNSADEPTLSVPTDQQSKELPALDAEIDQVQKRLADVEANAGGRQNVWERQFAGRTDVQWTVLDLAGESAGGATFTKLDDGSLLVGGKIPKKDTYTLRAKIGGEPITAVRIEVLPHENLPEQGPGLADNGNFVLSELSAFAGDISASTQGNPLTWGAVWADHSSAKGLVSLAVDGKSDTGWDISGPKKVEHVARTAVFCLKDDLRPSADGNPASGSLTLKLEQNYAKPRYLIGRLRVSVTSSPRDVLPLSDAVRAALAVPVAERSDELKEILRKEYQKIDPERLPLEQRIAELNEGKKQMKAAVTTTLVMRERNEPRETFIHVRGDFLHHGATVRPDVPEVLPPITPRASKADRLDFARWLVDPQHPLTARVTVNRIWQVYFGQGLVATENDFGLQGEPPTHPELLDWLARQLIAGDWSLKALHRQIVCSATYRQSSHTREDLVAADPYNRLLGRQARLRLEAETIRDCALASSEMLCRELGGPGVYPPQPEGIYKFTQQVKFWGENKNEERYRRGMYTYFWRSSPYPFLKTFDAPDATVACTRRARSNTPLQALTLANDRAFYEFAQGFAGRVLAMSEADDAQRLRTAFRAALTREPTTAELVNLAEYLGAERARFGAAPQEAAKAADRVAPANVSRVEAAAWTMLARVLLNLDEFITRE